MDKILSPRLTLQVFVDLPFMPKAVHEALSTWVGTKFAPCFSTTSAAIHVQTPDSEHGSNAMVILYDSVGCFDEVPDNIPIRRHKELNDRADIIYQKALTLLETHENMALLGK